MDHGQTAAKEVRMIEQAEKDFEKALSHLSDAVDHIGVSFAPVLAEIHPIATSEKALKGAAADSQFGRIVGSVVDKIHNIAEDINAVCQRSRV